MRTDVSPSRYEYYNILLFNRGARIENAEEEEESHGLSVFDGFCREHIYVFRILQSSASRWIKKKRKMNHRAR